MAKRSLMDDLETLTKRIDEKVNVNMIQKDVREIKALNKRAKKLTPQPNSKLCLHYLDIVEVCNVINAKLDSKTTKSSVRKHLLSGKFFFVFDG